ncbi:MAG: hypothetical protein NT069_00075, partial [Planctomycetota bacterium]|nr:hypothetical protein [Planctomycetota bacterium]
SPNTKCRVRTNRLQGRQQPTAAAESASRLQPGWKFEEIEIEMCGKSVSIQYRTLFDFDFWESANSRRI